MSYILDALQKSEHERRQKQHSVEINPFEEQEFSPSKSGSWLPWVLVGLLACVLGALVIVVGLQWSPSKSESMESNLAQVTESKTNPSLPSIKTGVPDSDQPDSQVPVSNSSDSHSSAKAVSADADIAVHKTLTGNERPIIKAQPVSSEVKRLYAISEQKRAKGQQQSSNEVFSSSKARPNSEVSAQSNADLSPSNDDNFDTDAIVAAALTQLQGGVPPSEPAEVNDPVNVSSSEAATVDLTSDNGAVHNNANNPTSFLTAAELPTGVQESLPNLKYTSHIYSSSSQKGFVVINGGKYVQGESVAPGVFIEKIQDEGVVLSFGGHLFFQEAMTDWEQP